MMGCKRLGLQRSGIHFEIDVYSGPCANYNRKSPFHLRLPIAVHLRKNQRFAEAQRWFHYTFDQTSSVKATLRPKCFWCRRFWLEADVEKIADLLTLVNKPEAECRARKLPAKNSVLCLASIPVVWLRNRKPEEP